MLVEVIVSVFGIAVVHRNLSLLEKSELISGEKPKSLFLILQFPFYFYLLFKELLPLVLIYIGIFSLTLIVEQQIFMFFRRKTFEKMHFHIVERLILLLRTGKSAKTSVKIIFSELNSFEKSVFLQLESIFADEKSKIRPIQSANDDFFAELATILQSTSHVIEQMNSFRELLRVQNDLRHRSEQVLITARAQGALCALIYAVFFAMSTLYFNLEVVSWPVLLSLTLFGVGQLLLYKLGRRIRWNL